MLELARFIEPEKALPAQRQCFSNAALKAMILPLLIEQVLQRIVVICMIFSALVQPFAMPLSSGLRAAGDVRFTMWSSIFTTVVCRTLLSFLLALWLKLGVIGIALAMVIDWCIKAVMDICRFRSGKWAGNRVI